jgi:hypothetical protein
MRVAYVVRNSAMGRLRCAQCSLALRCEQPLIKAKVTLLNGFTSLFGSAYRDFTSANQILRRRNVEWAAVLDCTHIYMCVCVCVCVYIKANVCASVCMYVFMCSIAVPKNSMVFSFGCLLICIEDHCFITESFCVHFVMNLK